METGSVMVLGGIFMAMAVSGSIGPAETSAAGVHAFPGTVSSPNPVDLARWL
jgi:hypothetical protein